MCPTEGQPQRGCPRAFRRGEMGIGTIGIDLDRVIEAVEDFGGIFPLSAGPVVEHHAGRRGAAPTAVFAQIGPEIAGLPPR